MLEPIIRWVVGQLTPASVDLRWADLRVIPDCPKGLAERIVCAVQYYPCQLLFVHRDAERQEPDLRYQEIAAAIAANHVHVGVVPVRMQEAWLLHDELAIRRAAGSPSGTQDLALPPARKWELLADPKQLLHETLRTASGLKGRRAKAFKPRVAVHRIPEYVDDWSALRQLGAFRRFEQDTRSALEALGLPLEAR